uniref:Uncharacterized protein n=1 Tax=Glossina morsitans morsitans TaxID=37546 RepID=A0A1B0FPI0_GLOMM
MINNERCGKNGPTVAGAYFPSSSTSLTPMILSAFIIAQKSPENIFVEHVSLYSTAFGLVAAKATNRHCSLIKAEMEYLDWSLSSPGLLFLNQHFKCVMPEI